MNRLEFEELELQAQQSGLPLKSYLQQAGISYSTYHYWRKNAHSIKGKPNRSWLQSASGNRPRNWPWDDRFSKACHFCFPTGFVPTSGTVQKGY